MCSCARRLRSGICSLSAKRYMALAEHGLGFVGFVAQYFSIIALRLCARISQTKTATWTEDTPTDLLGMCFPHFFVQALRAGAAVSQTILARQATAAARLICRNVRGEEA